jgi:hypothetical protein
VGGRQGDGLGREGGRGGDGGRREAGVVAGRRGGEKEGSCMRVITWMRRT